jgi:hypothetical protein
MWIVTTSPLFSLCEIDIRRNIAKGRSTFTIVGIRGIVQFPFEVPHACADVFFEIVSVIFPGCQLFTDASGTR